MRIKNQKGIVAADIVVSVLILTVFVAVIGNMSVKINMNSLKTERQSTAIAYAIQEIEKIKAQGYLNVYDGQGVSNQATLELSNGAVQDSDIKINNEFTGYHKKILIQDYVSLVNNQTKQSNILKKITVDISYNLSGQEQNVILSTYVTKR